MFIIVFTLVVNALLNGIAKDPDIIWTVTVPGVLVNGEPLTMQFGVLCLIASLVVATFVDLIRITILASFHPVTVVKKGGDTPSKA